jgi:hypothetical protein
LSVDLSSIAVHPMDFPLDILFLYTNAHILREREWVRFMNSHVIYSVSKESVWHISKNKTRLKPHCECHNNTINPLKQWKRKCSHRETTKTQHIYTFALWFVSIHCVSRETQKEWEKNAHVWSSRWKGKAVELNLCVN